MPLSQTLRTAIAGGAGDTASLAEVLGAVKSQALALMLVLFALPNVLPSLPGTSAITGAPLVILTLQMARGQGIWLPRALAERRFSRQGMIGILDRAAPYMGWIERLLRPRYEAFSGPAAQRLLGAIMLALSLLIMLPIPLANILPASAITLTALGLGERDGAFIAAGMALAALSVAVVAVVYGSAISWTLVLIAGWF